jgi:hypothetical protein
MSDPTDPDAVTGCADDQLWAGVPIEQLRQTKFRPDDPNGTLLDALQFSAWCGLIKWLLEQSWALDAFKEETGLSPPGRRSPIDAAIDQACGVDPLALFVGEFTHWATRDYWGEDEITPSIRAVLDRLPRRQ